VNRRELYRLIAAILPQAGGARPLLSALGNKMREIRGRPARQVPSWLTPHLPDLQPLLEQDDALGQIYQAINAPALEAAYRSTAHQRRKFTADEIPAVTQLFTPKWVVEFLLQNTLGRAWLEIHPDSPVKKHWKWLVADSGTQAKSARAVDLRICDPACGTMNFGLVALDMLRWMYRQEMDRAGRPGWPASPSCSREEEIDLAIVGANLIGFDIDPLAIELARQSLEIKTGRKIPKRAHQLSVRNTLFDPPLNSPFDVVVTNPPYLSARNIDPNQVRKLKKLFPSAWRDHYACFILRSLQMLHPGGRAGILSMHSFMFTAAFEKFRAELRDGAQIETVAHFGPGLFDIGNPGTLQTAATVFQRRPAPDRPAIFFRLVDTAHKQAALASAIGNNHKNAIRFTIDQSRLTSFPRLAWMYWICPASRRAFSDFKKLGEISPPRQGLATTDNLRFVRYWWEIEPPGYAGRRDKWIPYAKGGRFRRWYESPRHRVNWQDDGREIKAAIVQRYPYLNGQWQWVAKNTAWYGKEGITYSYLTSGAFSARRLEAGTIFDVAGSSLFPDDPLAMLGILNSSTARRLLAAINPTVNFQVGDLRQLPIPPALPEELRRHVRDAIEATRRLDRFDETSPEFLHPTFWNGADPNPADLRRQLIHGQRNVDRIIAELYGMNDDPTGGDIDDAKPAQLSRRWISYAVGVWLGRWGDRPMGDLAILSPLDEKLQSDLRYILAQAAGENAAAEIESAAGGLKRFLETEFLTWHARLYRGRPVIWGFIGNGRTVAISCLMANARSMRSAFAAIGQKLPDGWDRWRDDGVAINLAPLAQWVADRKLRLELAEFNETMMQGRLEYSATAKWMARRPSLSPGSICGSVPPRRRKYLASRSNPLPR
jgi:N-6 DNA Methylase